MYGEKKIVLLNGGWKINLFSVLSYYCSFLKFLTHICKYEKLDKAGSQLRIMKCIACIFHHLLLKYVIIWIFLGVFHLLVNGVSGRSWVQSKVRASPRWRDRTWKCNKWSSLRIKVREKVCNWVTGWRTATLISRYVPRSYWSKLRSVENLQVQYLWQVSAEAFCMALWWRLETNIFFSTSS